MGRVNDGEIIAIAAATAGVDLKSGFRIDREPGYIFVNHPDSMKWSREMRQAIKEAVEKRTGLKASVT